MKDEWNDFEKYVFEKLNDITEELSRLKAHARFWGVTAGILGVAIAEFIIKTLDSR